MNVLSLFSGIGGLDLGLQRAGMTIAGQVEIDPWCRKVLAKHWPEVPRHDDVRTAAAWWGGRRAPDVVCGGFPCQPVSLAGKGLAQADSRWLWPAFASIVRDLRPRFVLVENVPGLLGRGMGDVLGDLAAIGYDAEWDCVPAAFVGAPHIRNRVWIVAYPADGQPQEPSRDDAIHGQWSPQRRGSEQPSGSRAGGRAGGGNRPEGTDWDAAAIGRAIILADADGRGFAEQPERDSWPQPRIFAPFRHDPVRRDPHAADTDREPLGWPAEPRCERGHWVAEPGVGRVAHGIPGRVDRLRGLGNAVVPQVAEHIGRLIMNAAAP